jgi:hypothetical protein
MKLKFVSVRPGGADAGPTKDSTLLEMKKGTLCVDDFVDFEASSLERVRFLSSTQHTDMIMGISTRG